MTRETEVGSPSVPLSHDYESNGKCRLGLYFRETPPTRSKVSIGLQGSCRCTIFSPICGLGNRSGARVYLLTDEQDDINRDLVRVSRATPTFEESHQSSTGCCHWLIATKYFASRVWQINARLNHRFSQSTLIQSDYQVHNSAGRILPKWLTRHWIRDICHAYFDLLHMIRGRAAASLGTSPARLQLSCRGVAGLTVVHIRMAVYPAQASLLPLGDDLNVHL